VSWEHNKQRQLPKVADVRTSLTSEERRLPNTAGTLRIANAKAPLASGAFTCSALFGVSVLWALRRLEVSAVRALRLWEVGAPTSYAGGGLRPRIPPGGGSPIPSLPLPRN
jgi:hypothetical protein